MPLRFTKFDNSRLLFFTLSEIASPLRELFVRSEFTVVAVATNKRNVDEQKELLPLTNRPAPYRLSGPKVVQIVASSRSKGTNEPSEGGLPYTALPV